MTAVVFILSQMEGRCDLELLEAVSGVLALALVGSRDPFVESIYWFDPLAAAIRSEFELREAVS